MGSDLLPVANRHSAKHGVHLRGDNAVARSTGGAAEKAIGVRFEPHRQRI